MDYEDRIKISTPEGLELEVELAGIGSRLAAWLLDAILQLLIILAVNVALLTTIEDSASSAVAVIVATVTTFGVIWGYHVAFEAFRDGQTPGKRRLGIRVLDTEGGPVLFREAAVRNLIRPIDEALTMFMGALVSIARSERNQRIGDHAAGTIVARDAPSAEKVDRGELLLSESTWRLVHEAATWDTTRITPEQMAAARQWVDRRQDLPPERRAELAARLADSLRPQITGADPSLSPEHLIEALVALRATRG